MKWINKMLLLFLMVIAVTACLASPSVIDNSPDHAIVDDHLAMDVITAVDVESNYLYDKGNLENNTSKEKIKSVVDIQVFYIEKEEAITMVNETVLKTPVPPDRYIKGHGLKDDFQLTNKEIIVSIRDKLAKS